MKRLISVFAPAALTVALASACGGSRQPPTDLTQARAAYADAERGPAAKYNRTGLAEARAALDDAEKKYDDYPRSDAVGAAAYKAKRQAQIADADARTVQSRERQQQADKALAQMHGQTAQSLEAAATRSERRAKMALGRLGLAAKEEPRGTVVTLPGASMFAVDKAEILPGAQKRLTEIATAVKQLVAQKAPQDVGRKMELIGYTDSTGTPEHNNDLSQKRAEAVRDFFAKHGIKADWMQTEGRGEADPIADNSTSQGRAQNRRVEIVITPQPGQQPQEQQQQGGGSP